MLEQKLTNFGLRKKEILIYTTILELRKASASQISSNANIKRPTVYAVCNELIKKGLIQAETTTSTIYYLPTPTHELPLILEKETQKIKLKKELLAEIALEIETIPSSKTYSVPKIRFIEHEENVAAFLYTHMEIWNKSMREQDHTWWGFQDHTFVENTLYKKWIDWQWNEQPKNIDLKMISNNSGVERDMKKKKLPLRHIKFWKGSKNFSASQWIVGDYSIMIMTNKKPHYLVQIHDSVYAENMRELFKNLWEEII